MNKLRLPYAYRVICQRCEKLLFEPDAVEATYELCRICLHTAISSEDYFDHLFEEYFLDSPEQ